MSNGLEAPLAGYLVLDMAQFLSGPSAALRLADLGARVIKIVNAGLIPGQRSGAKPGQWVGQGDMERAPIGSLCMLPRFGSCGDDLAGFGIDDLGGGLVLLRPH